MNRKIKLLDNNLINKIAAGEVVERPASIVKELVENSIDAGSKNITIEIKNGGISFIKIQDDGSGIPKDEIKTAFLRHATSKLEKIDDLDDMLTLGFRGEALSSICSISMVEMTTKTKQDSLANKITIEGSNIIKEEEVAGLNGTTFIIKNIFYNTPARRKFLKKDSVEAGYISEIVNRLALAYPDISFRYINNGTEVLKTNGDGELKNTIFSVYGKEVCKNLINIEDNKNGFGLKGFITFPKLSRGNRSYENFFINGRYIKSSLVSGAIEDAYDGKLMIGKFPIYILNMTTPANTVDVNVHPTKLEVRFADENFIYSFLNQSIKKALDEQNLIPSVEIDKSNDIEDKQDKSEEQKPKNFYEVEKTIPFNVEKQKELEEILLQEDDEEYDFIKDTKHLNNVFFVNEDNDFIFDNKNNESSYTKDVVLKEEKEEIKTDEKTLQDTKQKKHSFFNNYKIVGQLFNTYWIVEQDKEMYMIDQHSAHERIIYEQLLESFKNHKVSSQKLLEPIVINATFSESQVIEKNKELLQNFGFDIEEFGSNCYAIRSVPFIFTSPVEPSYINDLIDILADKNIQNLYDTKIEKIISMSCKKAVKANDKLSFIEAKALIENILKIDNPFSCPHGRPTIIKMTKYEIEKMFKRIQN